MTRRRLRTLTALTVSALACALVLPTAAVAAPAADPPKATVATKRDRVDARTDERRATKDLKPLQRAGCLDRVAQDWAKHMARTGKMVHRDMAVVMRRCPGAMGVGENIAYGYGTASSVVKAWMTSPGHRENILNPRWDSIGVGAWRSADGTWWWVQNFGDLR